MLALVSCRPYGRFFGYETVWPAYRLADQSNASINSCPKLQGLQHYIKLQLGIVLDTPPHSNFAWTIASLMHAALVLCLLWFVLPAKSVWWYVTVGGLTPGGEEILAFDPPYVVSLVVLLLIFQLRLTYQP